MILSCLDQKVRLINNLEIRTHIFQVDYLDLFVNIFNLLQSSTIELEGVQDFSEGFLSTKAPQIHFSHIKINSQYQKFLLGFFDNWFF